MPFRALSPKGKSRLLIRIKGPRTKKEQQAFRKGLQKLIRKNRATFINVPRGGGG